MTIRGEMAGQGQASAAEGALPAPAQHERAEDELEWEQEADWPAERALPRAGEWSYQLLLMVALLLGWGLRLLFWWQQSRYGVVAPLSDEEEYYRGAIHIFKDLSYYDTSQWLRAPLPSAVLALGFALTGGPNLPLALALQALLSGLAVLPVAATARSLFESRRAGLFAAYLTALYVPFAVAAGQLMSEASAILTIALSLWLLERWRVTLRARWLWLAGVALGAFTLGRAMGLYAQLLVLLWVWWRLRGWRQILLGSVAFLLGFWLVVAPWSVRNTLAFGRLVLVDTNAGFSFWNGTEEPGGHEPLQGEWNRTIANPADRQARQFERALENIQRDPAAWAVASRYKVASLWQLRVRGLIANNQNTLAPATISPSLTLLGDAQYVLVVLAAIATVVALARRDFHWLLVAWPLYGTALSAVSMGHPRLRVPLEVALVILAAYGLAHPLLLWRRLRAGSRWRLVALPVGALGFLLLIYASVYLGFLRSQATLTSARVQRALEGAAPDLAAAEAAVRAQPNTAPPLIALASLQEQAGDERSVATWEQVVALDQHIILGHAWLLYDALARGDQQLAQRRLDAIRAIHRDDNALYTWLWERRPRPAQPSVDLGTNDDLGLIAGFGAPQQEGQISYRWTQVRQAQVQVPGGTTGRLRLRVRGWRPGGVLRVLSDGVPLGLCSIATQWRDCTLDLPAQSAELTITLQSSLDVPWPPEDYLPRGVAVDRVWIE